MYGFFSPFALYRGMPAGFCNRSSILRERLDFSIRPAAVLASLTAWTTSWNQVRLPIHPFIHRRTPKRGSFRIANHTLPVPDAERTSVAQTERLAKLAAFQLQMLRHAMKCDSSHSPLPRCGVILIGSGQLSSERRKNRLFNMQYPPRGERTSRSRGPTKHRSDRWRIHIGPARCGASCVVATGTNGNLG